MSAKYAIVLGIQDSVGWAVADALRKDGYSVVALAQDEALKSGKKQGLGWDAYCDTTDGDNVECEIDKACKSLPRIDALVCLADHKLNCAFEDTSLEDFDRLIEGNLTYAMRASRNVMKMMRRQKKGSIVFVASAEYSAPAAGEAAYAASFGGIESFTRSASIDAAAFDARVNCITVKDRKDNVTGLVKAVQFLASDESNYITGATLSLDGVLRH